MTKQSDDGNSIEKSILYVLPDTRILKSHVDRWIDSTREQSREQTLCWFSVQSRFLLNLLPTKAMLLLAADENADIFLIRKMKFAIYLYLSSRMCWKYLSRQIFSFMLGIKTLMKKGRSTSSKSMNKKIQTIPVSMSAFWVMISWYDTTCVSITVYLVAFR